MRVEFKGKLDILSIMPTAHCRDIELDYESESTELILTSLIPKIVVRVLTNLG